LSDKRAAPRTAQKSALERSLAAVLLAAEEALDAGQLDLCERELQSAIASDARCAEAHYLLGELARRRGDLQSARRQFRKSIDLDADLACAHHALGNSLQDAGELEPAISAYRRALRISSDAAEVWNDLGTAYFASGEPVRAADCYRNALRLSPAHVVATSNLASTLRALGDVRSAFAAYLRELKHRLMAALRPRGAQPAGAAAAAERWLRRGSIRLAESLADLALAENGGDAAALGIKARAAERRHDPAAALDFLTRALHSAPKRDDLWLRLARLQRERGDAVEALRSYRGALAAGARDVEVERELALALAATGSTEEARTTLERLGRKHDAQSWSALATMDLERADRAAAERNLERALATDSRCGSALTQLSRLRVAQRKASEALALCAEAEEAEPSNAEARFWRGRALALQAKWDEASDAFREAAAIAPTNTVYVRWLALSLRAAERLDESRRVLREALERRPDDFDLTAELASTILESGEVSRARQMLQTLLERSPAHPGAIAALSCVLNAEGLVDEAIAYGRHAVAMQPEDAVPHVNLATALLKNGNYAEGWEHYAWRTRMPEDAPTYLRFPYPEWEAGSLAGKSVLVYAEQGLGDEIMFASCLPDVVREARQVTLECDPRLAELFQRSFSGCAVFGRKRTQANAWVRSLEPQPELQAPIGSLARHMRRQPSDFPAHSGYLKPDPAKVERARARLAALGPGRKIGVSWRGGLMKTGRARRSLETGELASLLKLEGVNFVSLQYGAGVADEIARLEQTHRVRMLRVPEAIDDYDEAAALISVLDGVISVCTAVVHLTGALGRPVLVLAPYSAEWRYGARGEQMIWYPSVRVLRQSVPGEWGTVIAEARAVLAGGRRMH
jgi:tetratricopeptide (TPR) repeat protein